MGGLEDNHPFDPSVNPTLIQKLEEVIRWTAKEVCPSKQDDSKNRHAYVVHDSLGRVHPEKGCKGKSTRINDEILRESMCRLYSSMWKCRQRDGGNCSRPIGQYTNFDRGYQTKRSRSCLRL